MVRSLHFHLKGHRFQPCCGTRIMHTMECDKKKKFVLYDVIDKKFKNRKNWDFPGDPVAKIPCYSIPGQGTRSHLTQLKIPHAITKTQHRQINRFKRTVGKAKLQ